MKKNRLAMALIIVIVPVTVIAGAVIVLEQFSNPKITCSASVNSNIGTSDNSPVVDWYFPDREFEPIPQSVNMSLRITNNASKTLYNIVAEVKYKTSEGSWKTTSKTVIDVFPIFAWRDVDVPLADAAIEIRNSTQIRYFPEPVNVPIIEYVLASRDHEIAAYGFAKK